MRKSWDQYFIEMAEKAAERATCDRLHVGAILVKDKRIVGTGYNGSVAGHEHCTDSKKDIMDGGCLNDERRCVRTIHAEANALLQAGHEAKGSTAYVTHEPCESCTKLLAQAGVVRVVFLKEYKNPFNQFFNTGMEWEHYKG